MTAKVLSACVYRRSFDGGSGHRAQDMIPCDGRHWSDGRLTGGCGEPCRFAMLKEGEGNPPLPPRRPQFLP